MNNKIEELITIEKERSEFSESLIMETLYKLKDDSLKDDFRIAVIGEFSVGKSTFINALLGRKLLTSKLTEATAAITRINNVLETDVKCNTVDVHFEVNKEVLSFSVDDIERLCKYTVKSEGVDVASVVNSVDVYVNIEGALPFSIIDTPGLNGLSEKHKEITLNEIEKAHVCIFLTDIKGVTTSNLEIIDRIDVGRNKTLVVVNQIDRINSSENETRTGKIKEVKESIATHYPELNYELFAVSSLTSLEEKRRGLIVNRDFKVLEEALSDIYKNGSKIKKLHCENKISNIKEKIESLIIGELQVLDISLKEEFSEVDTFSSIHESNNEKRLLALEKKLKYKTQIIENNLLEIWGAYSLSILGDIEECMLKYKGLETFHNAIPILNKGLFKLGRKKYNAITSTLIKELKEIEHSFYFKINIIFNTNKDDGFNNLKYDITEEVDWESLDVKAVNDDILKLENDKKEKEETLSFLSGRIMNIEDGFLRLKREIGACKNELGKIEKRKRTEIREIGSQPPREIKYKPTGILFWKKEEFSHYDYSKQDQWKSRKDTIIKRFETEKAKKNKLKTKLEEQSKTLTENKSKIEKSQREYTLKISDLKEDIEGLKTSRKEDLRVFEIKKLKKIKKETLEMYRKSLANRCLDISGVLQRNTIILRKGVKDYYKNKNKQFLEDLKARRQSLTDGVRTRRLHRLKEMNLHISNL